MRSISLIAAASMLGISLLSLSGCKSNISTPAEPTTIEQDSVSENESETPAATEVATPEPAIDDSPVKSTEISVTVKTWEEVQRLIADQSGKVVVVDLWSTWCGPCMREFPHLVKLHEEFQEQVSCISMDLDYIGLEDEPPESFRGNVMTFLSQHNATFTNVISADTDEQVFRTLEISSIPAVLVYDREGTLQKKFTNDENEYGDAGFTYSEHIVPMVKQLIDK